MCQPVSRRRVPVTDFLEHTPRWKCSTYFEAKHTQTQTVPRNAVRFVKFAIGGEQAASHESDVLKRTMGHNIHTQHTYIAIILHSHCDRQRPARGDTPQQTIAHTHQ